MLCGTVERAFDRSVWLFEIKSDGSRAISAVEPKTDVRLYSRQQNSLAERFPEIASGLRKLKHQVVFDGEIVVLNATGHPTCEAFSKRPRPSGYWLVYYVFDVLFLDGEDLRDRALVRSLVDCKRKLKSYFQITSRPFASQCFEKAVERGLEGVVAKKPHTAYRSGRSSDWLINKNKKQGLPSALETGIGRNWPIGLAEGNRRLRVELATRFEVSIRGGEIVSPPD